MTVIELIAKEMKKKNISINQLARNTGIDNGNLSKLLRGLAGGRRPGFNMIMRIMRALNMDMKRLNEVEL